jgi:hypothetical protein
MRVRRFSPISHTRANAPSAGIETVGGAPLLLPRLALTQKYLELDIHHDFHIHHAALPGGSGARPRGDGRRSGTEPDAHPRGPPEPAVPEGNMDGVPSMAPPTSAL